LTARDTPDRKRREEGGNSGKGKRKKRTDEMINPIDVCTLENKLTDL